MSKFELNPGIPFTGTAITEDAPEGSIRNNTNSNTHIPPHPPVLQSKVFADGIEDSWLEYIPKDLDKETKPPLIISCHGGGAHASMQFDETSWCYIAEQEGCVAVFPNAGGLRRAWLTVDDPEKVNELPNMMDIFGSSPDGRVEETHHHIRFLKALIKEMHEKYNIDEGRVYLQGMSMGDIMTMMFARVCGDLLAGIDSTAGPSPQMALFDDEGNVRGFKCPVPVYQSRGELDDIVAAPVAGKGENTTRQDVNDVNREFWLKVNGCDELPRLSILDVNNFAFYTGKGANLVYRDVKHRSHGQTLDDAYWAWNTLFKGTRRNADGSISCLDTDYSARGDVDAAALCDGAAYAYINNSRVKLEAPAFLETLTNYDFQSHSRVEYKKELYVPVSFLSQYFDISVDYAADGRSAILHCLEGDCQIAEASVATLWDGFLRSMLMPVIRKDGVLFVAVRWFAEVIFGMHVTECDGAMYICDHHAEMSKDMAYLIKEILS